MHQKLLILFMIMAFPAAACVRRIPAEAGYRDFPLMTAEMAQEGEKGQSHLEAAPGGTASPSPGPDDKGGKVLQIGFLDQQLFIVLEMPGEIHGSLFGKMGTRRFDCTQQIMFPDRLYCFGESPEKGENEVFILLSNDEKEVMRVEIPINYEH
jgi:hypothetical protein